MFPLYFALAHIWHTSVNGTVRLSSTNFMVNVKYFLPLVRTKCTSDFLIFSFLNYSYVCHSAAIDGRRSKCRMTPTSVTIRLGNSHPTRDQAKYTCEQQLLLEGNYILPLYLMNTKASTTSCMYDYVFLMRSVTQTDLLENFTFCGPCIVLAASQRRCMVSTICCILYVQ